MGIFTKLFGSKIEKDLAEGAEASVNRTIRETFARFADVEGMNDQLQVLKQQKATLSEDIAREKLELRHKLGLERMRQAQEAEIASERLEAQKEAIETERDLAIQAARFEAKKEAMEETREAMKEFQDRQETMIQSLLEALPTAEIFKKIEG